MELVIENWYPCSIGFFLTLDVSHREEYGITIDVSKH
jgi:hypothetical protein